MNIYNSRNNLYVLILANLVYYPFSATDNSVTFELNGGRFGDNLISCSQAYWIHHIYNIPLLFKPFLYSDALHIHYEHALYTPELIQSFNTTTKITSHSSILEKSPHTSTLYVTTFKQDPGVDWSDVAFVDKFRTAISPIDEQQNSARMIAHDVHTIAIHIRRGGNFSYDKQIHTKIPQQFPSLDFYIQALQLLLRHLEGPCHVYIFTDDNKPKNLAKKIRKHLSQQDQNRVVMMYRSEENNYTAPVLSDFFDMMQCKYLIRPSSHFSLFVEQLGTCVLSIYPVRAQYRKHTWGHVTEIEIAAYIEGECRTDQFPLDIRTKKNDIPLLHIPQVKKTLLYPAYRPQNRRLKAQLCPCY